MKEEIEQDLKKAPSGTPGHISSEASASALGTSEEPRDPSTPEPSSLRHEAERYIQEHPLASLVIALSVGIVVGRMFR